MSFDLTPHHVIYVVETILVGIVLGFYVHCVRWVFSQKCKDHPGADPPFRFIVAIIGTIVIFIGVVICTIGQFIAMHNGYWAFWQYSAS